MNPYALDGLINRPINDFSFLLVFVSGNAQSLMKDFFFFSDNEVIHKVEITWQETHQPCDFKMIRQRFIKIFFPFRQVFQIIDMIHAQILWCRCLVGCRQDTVTPLSDSATIFPTPPVVKRFVIAICFKGDRHI